MPYYLLRYRWSSGGSSGPREKVVQAVDSADAASSFTNDEIKEVTDTFRREEGLKVRVYEISEECDQYVVKPAGVTVEKIVEEDRP